MKGDPSMSGSLPPGIAGNEKAPCIFLDNYRDMRLDHAHLVDVFVFDPLANSSGYPEPSQSREIDRTSADMIPGRREP